MTGAERPDPAMLTFADRLREEFDRLQAEHQFAVDQMQTKVSVLRREFLLRHRYNPIEHVTARVKSPASILAKAARLGIEPTIHDLRTNIHDIAGVRISCSFIADTYRVLEALTSQDDVQVLGTKDYISTPKANGYRSLHALVSVPVFLSTGPVPVTVELQVRTIAMDFWASLEHKIHYKYDGAVPADLVARLTAAARTARELDESMEQLHAAVRGHPADHGETSSSGGIDAQTLGRLWDAAQREARTGQPEASTSGSVTSRHR